MSLEKCIFQPARAIHQEYLAVCSLLQRSGLHDISKLPLYLGTRSIHSSTANYQKPPNNDKDPKKPKRDEDDDKDKISSVLAKAFLWMLTAYMVIAIISLLFPSSNQPEVSSVFK